MALMRARYALLVTARDVFGRTGAIHVSRVTQANPLNSRLDLNSTPTRRPFTTQFSFSPLTVIMHTSEYDYLFKLLLIGDSGVGKVQLFIVLKPY